jgi:hypothetical protein
MQSGLARLPILPYTDHEWEMLPNVILTAEPGWDPSVLDHVPPDDEAWGVVPEDKVKNLVPKSPFDKFDPADILHKQLDYLQIRSQLKELIFWMGDKSNIED